MTNANCEESDGVRKVRLRTTSGVLTLCYRSSQSSREDDDSQDGSSVEKASQGGSKVSDVNKESGFGSLPELFEFPDQFSIGEGSDGWTNSSLDLQPDFSTYKFWASESARSLPHVGCLSFDTFSRCDLAGMIDQVGPGLQPVTYDGQGPDAFQNCATEADPHSQDSLNSSAIGEMDAIPSSCWDFPPELEEDLSFDCANYLNLLNEVTNERDVDRESMVNGFLVDRSPEFSDVVANVENFDRNLLLYAPNRYLEDRCIFQSPADLKIKTSDVQTLRTTGGDRINESMIDSRRKRDSLRQSDHPNDGQSMDIKSRNSDDSSAISQFGRSPKDSRKKSRTMRRRPLEGWPKKSHFYGNIIEAVSGHLVQDTPERQGVSGTKLAVSKGRRRLPLASGSVEILQGWLHENLRDPYPSQQEKEYLSVQTALKVSQIDSWLGNARQKLKLKSRAVKDLWRESSSSPEQHKKRSKRKHSYSLKMQI